MEECQDAGYRASMFVVPVSWPNTAARQGATGAAAVFYSALADGRELTLWVNTERDPIVSRFRCQRQLSY